MTEEQKREDTKADVVIKAVVIGAVLGPVISLCLGFTIFTVSPPRGSDFGPALNVGTAVSFLMPICSCWPSATSSVSTATFVITSLCMLELV